MPIVRASTIPGPPGPAASPDREPRHEDERRRCEERDRALRSGDATTDPRSYPYVEPLYRRRFPHIGCEPQLMLDHGMLDWMDGCRRELAAPGRQRLQTGDGLRWEAPAFTGVTAGAARDPDSGRWRLWYLQRAHRADGAIGLLCHAESDDGVTWRRTLRDDLVPFEELRRTNIVLDDCEHAAVVANPRPSGVDDRWLCLSHAPREARRRGLRAMSRVWCSGDGLRWRLRCDQGPLPHQHQPRLLWDPTRQRWLCYGQHSHYWNLGGRRQIGLQESDDLERWTPREAILSADSDPTLPVGAELHEMGVLRRGGTYVGIAGMALGRGLWRNHDHDGRNVRDAFATRLALHASRDGLRFTRAHAAPVWFEPGEPGSWDHGYTAHAATESALVADGRMLIPYLAMALPQRAHLMEPGLSPGGQVPAAAAADDDAVVRDLRAAGTEPTMRGVDGQRSIGGLVLREDGWACVRPSGDRGLVWLRQVVLAGSRLELNLDARAGLARVALLDPRHEPYPGFAFGDCLTLHGPADRIWHRVAWRGDPDLRRLGDSPVRIAIELTMASLYAIRCAGDEP